MMVQSNDIREMPSSQRWGPIRRWACSAHRTWWWRLAIHWRPETVIF